MEKKTETTVITPVEKEAYIVSDAILGTDGAVASDANLFFEKELATEYIATMIANLTEIYGEGNLEREKDSCTINFTNGVLFECHIITYKL